MIPPSFTKSFVVSEAGWTASRVCIRSMAQFWIFFQTHIFLFIRLKENTIKTPWPQELPLTSIQFQARPMRNLPSRPLPASNGRATHCRSRCSVWLRAMGSVERGTEHWFILRLGGERLQETPSTAGRVPKWIAEQDPACLRCLSIRIWANPLPFFNESEC